MKHLTLGHLRVPIVHDPDMEEAGQYRDWKGHEIRVNTAVCPEGSPEYFHTLFHEALHAILNITGLNADMGDLEELIVRALEIHIANLFRDNPDFQLDYLEVVNADSA